MNAKMAYIIELSIVTFLCAYLLPPSIAAIMAANVTGNASGTGAWNPAVVTIFQVLLPILVIVTIALALMPQEIKGKVGL